MSTSYESLTLSDDYMFCKVMTARPDLCKTLLEAILDKEISELKNIDKQKVFDVAPDSHGIRLDVYIKDTDQTVYDIEMQTTSNPYLPQRSRYYNSIIDIDELEKGKNYSELRSTYVIFVCTFDPFGKELPVYHFENICKEDMQLFLEDGTFKVFLNVTAKVPDNPLLEEFFEYVSYGRINGTLTEELHKTVLFARKNRKWRREYMQNQAKYMDAVIMGREEEKANTEKERKRADIEAQRADQAEAELQELKEHFAALQKQLEQLKTEIPK